MLLNKASFSRTISVAALTFLAAVAQAQPTQVRDIPPRPVAENEDELNRFTAANTVQATVNDINIPGKLIDAAISAGANRVDSLRFSVKDDLPLRKEALRLASIQARQRADSIALGLGVRLGAVLDAQEGYSVVPVASIDSAVAATVTPIVPGSVDVRATVTLDIEITQ